MKYALKSVPGLADVGVSHGDGDGPRAASRCEGGPEKFQINNFSMSKNEKIIKKAHPSRWSLISMKN